MGSHLRHASEPLRAALATAPILAFVLDSKGVMIEAVGAGSHVLRTPADAVGRSAFEQYSDMPWLTAALRRALSGDVVEACGDVQGVPHDAHVAPLRNERGAITGVVGLAVDATRRTQAERERATSQSVLRATLDSTADGLLVVDTQGRIALFNSRFAEMWRIPEELLAERDNQRVLAYVRDQFDDPGPFLAKVQALYRTPEAQSFDVFQLKDGRIFEQFSRPQRLGEDIVGRVWSFRDVTQRQRTEEALKASQDQLAKIIDGSPALIYVKDLEGRYLLVNSSFENFLNLPRDRLLGKNDHELFPGELADLYRGNDLEVLQAKRPLEWEERWDGVHTLLSLKFPLVRPDGTVYALCGVSTDITERKRIAEERLRLIEEQELFVKVAAHELKTPVAVIKSYAQLALRESRELPPRTSKLLKGIDRGTVRIDALVRDLLDVSQLHFGALRMSPHHLELRALLESVGREMKVKWPERRIRLHAEHPVFLQGDADRLAQVVRVLVDNALRYSPGGQEVELSLSVHDDEVVVAVEDRGVGIPAHKQSRIFERFYRAHTGTAFDYGGMGVGLHIAQRVIRQHGGRMWFQSEEGVGSRFEFSLPRTPLGADDPRSAEVAPR